MPYKDISELPKSVRNLPSRAKTLYMKAFNGFWDDYDVADEAAREKASHEAAWSAVKEQYQKDDDTGDWVKIEEMMGRRSRHTIRHRKSKTGTLASQNRAHA